jgi:tetratricopeptide (TPR) repeat protein
MSGVKRKLQKAVAHREQGRLDEAARLCSGILTNEPRNFDALHLAAAIKHQQGQLADALRLVASALREQPKSVDALVNHGIILDALRRHEEALASFDRVLSVRGGDAELHRLRAEALLHLGRREDALASCDRAVEIAPNFGPAHFSRGCILVGLDRSGEALASFDRVIALALARVSPEAANGCVSVSAERLEKAFAIDRDVVGAFYNCGTILLSLKRYEDACASFSQALALNPGYVDALGNRGVALAELGRYGDALADYDKALRIAPNQPDVHANRGNAYLALNRMDEALRSYGGALTLDPGHGDANFGTAVTRLVLGDFRLGWPQYEARWFKKRTPVPRPDYPQPVWRGEQEIEGKTVLLCAEQGLGDTIQFARYAPMVAALGAKVVLKVHSSLVALMATVPGVSQAVAGDGALPAFDLYCPLLSLPLAFGTELKTIPANIPYVRVSEDRITKWGGRIPGTGRLRVGVCWTGTKTHVNDRNRSIPIERFAQILSIPNLDFISVQKEIDETEAAVLRDLGVAQLGQDFADFADTAAVFSLLDLLVTVDTAVAHLAGAMGKAVALLLPFSPDFRWLLDRTDSPWYPTMRLFRQTAIGDWAEPLERLRRELAGVACRPQPQQRAAATASG